jgi:hypothetical protein
MWCWRVQRASVTPVSKVKFIARGGYYHEVRIRTVMGSVVCNRRLMLTLLIGYCCVCSLYIAGKYFLENAFGFSGFLVPVLFFFVCVLVCFLELFNPNRIRF